MKIKIEALPCPFCGKLPKIESDHIYGEAQILCSNENCLIQPSRYLEANRVINKDGKFIGYDFEETNHIFIEMWNKRV